MESTSFPDPLNIRANAAKIVKKLSFVSINQAALTRFAKKVNQAARTDQLLTESQFGQLKNSPQKIFLLDTVNFCFWAEKGEAKWSIEHPEKNVVDGWQALVACFDRALAEKIDKMILIKPGSREELEIRAATVWVGELLAQQLQLSAVTIDNIIWSLSQKLKGKIKPYHRTLTTNY